MKNIFLRFLLLACVALPHLSWAQGINVSTTGDVCPNNNYTYTYTGSALGCNWVVKGAYTLVSGGGTNSTSITVRWKDLPTDATSNPTSVSMDCGAGGITTRAVFVSSISDQTPGPLTINGTPVSAAYTLPFGDATAVTLRVPLVVLPQSNPNAVTLYALTYDWVIPSGWRYNDNSQMVSNGTTPHRVGGGGNQISVTPAPGTGGTISVRAINNNCVGASSGPDNSTSQLQSFNLIRSTPQLTIISDKSLSGGNFSIACGDNGRNYYFSG